MIDLMSFIIYLVISTWGNQRYTPPFRLLVNDTRVRYWGSRLYIAGTRAGCNIFIFSFKIHYIIIVRQCGVWEQVYENVTHCTTHELCEYTNRTSVCHFLMDVS